MKSTYAIDKRVGNSYCYMLHNEYLHPYIRFPNNAKLYKYTIKQPFYYHLQENILIQLNVYNLMSGFIRITSLPNEL